MNILPSEVSPRVRRIAPAAGVSIAVLLVGFLLWARCSPEAFVNVTVGPLALDLPVPLEAIPAVMLAPDGTVVRVPCGPGASCPPSPLAGVDVSCASGTCALAPLTLDGTTADVDLDQNSSFQDFVSMLHTVGVERGLWRLQGLPAGHGIGPVELWWGPAGSAVEASAAHHLGTFPRVDPTATDMSGEMSIDAAGVRALSDHVLGGSRRIRFRARGVIRVNAGSARPAAVIHAALSLIVSLNARL